jgi:predicted DNA-binding transcriptional regulator AlpA
MAQAQMEKVMLSPAEVVAAGYARSKVNLWRMRKDPTFPKPLRLGPQSIGYRKADLDKWLAEREPA